MRNKSHILSVICLVNLIYDMVKHWKQGRKQLLVVSKVKRFSITNYFKPIYENYDYWFLNLVKKLHITMKP